jgi:hypothetical protein
MKTMTTFIFTLAATFSFAQDKFTAAMLKNIDAVYSAKTTEEFRQAINSFDRIANAEKTKWEPYYYSSFGNIMLANQEKDAAKKDAYLDLALASVEKGEAIAPKESELVALEGFVHMSRIAVDPASRGQKYSGQGMRAFGKAVSLNPENPRALCLMAQMQFGTADFLGSPVTEACSTARAAVEKFSTGKSENPLAPVWGKEMAEGLVARCK